MPPTPTQSNCLSTIVVDFAFFFLQLFHRHGETRPSTGLIVQTFPPVALDNPPSLFSFTTTDLDTIAVLPIPRRQHGPSIPARLQWHHLHYLRRLPVRHPPICETLPTLPAFNTNPSLTGWLVYTSPGLCANKQKANTSQLCAHRRVLMMHHHSLKFAPGFSARRNDRTYADYFIIHPTGIPLALNFIASGECIRRTALA